MQNSKPAKGFKDTFNLFMLEGSEPVTEMELPYIDSYEGPLPAELIAGSRKKNISINKFVHFYLYDYVFDNSRSLWHGISKDSRLISNFLNWLRSYQGVIVPDYSVYRDMPLIMQVWNIYRARAVCVWLRHNGINTIFNINWGDARTYKYAFNGIAKHSVLSVGTHGAIQDKAEYHVFLNGFEKMLERLEPKTLVIYGPLTKEIIDLCDQHTTIILHFDCEIEAARKGEKNGQRKN